MVARTWGRNLTPVLGAIAVVGSVVVTGCSSTAPPPSSTVSTTASTSGSTRGTAAPSTATSGTTTGSVAGTATTDDPFAKPSEVFTAKDTSVAVRTGDRFGIELPQDPAAGSWSFSQKAGPVSMVSGGSGDQPDGTRVQSFTFKANEPGTVTYTFEYAGGTPPGVSTPITFTITVT